MIIFVITVLVPACIFCGVVFVQFQREMREILKGRRKSLSAGKMIALNCHEKALPGAEFHDSASGLARVVGGEISVASARPAEFYQLESAYIGPLFIMRTENGDGWQLT